MPGPQMAANATAKRLVMAPIFLAAWLVLPWLAAVQGRARGGQPAVPISPLPTDPPVSFKAVHWHCLSGALVLFIAVHHQITVPAPDPCGFL